MAILGAMDNIKSAERSDGQGSGLRDPTTYGRSQRVADRGLGRLSWAGSGHFFFAGILPASCIVSPSPTRRAKVLSSVRWRPGVAWRRAISTLVCAKCDNTVQPEDRFCMHCGNDLSLPSTVKKTCQYCGYQSPPDHSFCENCGWDLATPERIWYEGLTGATVIHWLAQAQRHLDYPLDSSERSGWPAFDYAWRAFNHLYNLLEPGKFNEMDRAKKALEKTELPTLVLRLERVAASAPQAVSNTTESTTSIKTTSWSSLEELCKRLANRTKDAEPLAPMEFVKTIYGRRNIRTHGSEEGGSLKTARRVYESDLVKWGTKVMIDICEHLVPYALKTPYSPLDVKGYIRSRELQLIDELQTGIAALPPRSRAE